MYLTKIKRSDTNIETAESSGPDPHGVTHRLLSRQLPSLTRFTLQVQAIAGVRSRVTIHALCAFPVFLDQNYE